MVFFHRDSVSILTYSYAYLVIGNIGLVQLVSEVVVIYILFRRVGKIFGALPSIILFVTSNIVGGFIACYIDLLANLGGYRIYSIYVGNYSGIMAMMMLLALYRPKMEQWGFIILPWGIPLPYKSQNINIAVINLGIAVGFTYYYLIPLNYICFPSIFATYAITVVAYKLFFSPIVYGECPQEMDL